jgi:hypothetical protein
VLPSTACRLVRCALLLVLFCEIAGRPAAALNDPNQFCTGNPCVIASPKSADAGAVLDFGTRTVVLQSALEVLPQAGGAIGSLTIKAGSFSIVGNGQIKAFSATKPAGTVAINAANFIQIDDTLASGAIRLSGQNGGTLVLTTTSGSVTCAGRLTLFGDGTQASAGQLTIVSGSRITLSGALDIDGGAQAAGGSATLTAAADVSVTGQLDLHGGNGGGGSLDIKTGGALTLGTVDLSGSGDDGDAGQAFITAGGNVTLLGDIDARGADAGESCGDGGDLDIDAGGDITISGQLHMQGRGADCSGGSLTLDGARVFLQSTMDLSGTGSGSDGGDLDVAGSSLIRFSGSVALDGGLGGAGDASFASDGDVEVLGHIDAHGRLSASDGSITDIDGTSVTVTGSIDTSSGNASMVPGKLTLSGCDVVTQPSAVLKSAGNGDAILVEARDSLMLRGHFTASLSAGITLHYSSKANPPDLTGAVFSPAPHRALDVTLPACRVCETNADCSDGDDCTTDVCSGFTTCLHQVRTGACEDGDPCTTGETCVAGACVGGGPTSCEDGSPCTADACVAGVGCVHAPVPGTCDDGDACTLDDACAGGACVGTPMDCSDGDPCTDDTCSAGVCGHPFNTAPCDDRDGCTSSDRCSGGSCSGGPPTDCNDHNVCTADSCSSPAGCAHDAIVGCVDDDGDGIPDDVDACVTRSWTLQPTTPPDQNPLKFALSLGRLADPGGGQTLLMAGLFNIAPPTAQPIDPASTGVHIRIADAVAAVLDVSIPGGTGCSAGDGWSAHQAGVYTAWRYRNRSGMLPPSCLPGSAHGIESIQIKDRRATLKAALQFKVKAKRASLLRVPALPLTRMQVSLALGAQPAPGVASPQARAGQCAEALFTGDPISTKAKPSCKPKQKNAALIAVRCRGL